jgi:diguanylate cyclase (GGDEF)-like protein
VATETPTRNGTEPGRLARELFADAAQRLADEFGSVAAAAVGSLQGEAAASAASVAAEDEHPSLYRPGQMRRRLDQLLECHRRYEQRFALVVFDVEGPGARGDDGGRQTALAVVGAALGESIRLVDETFRLEEDALCVLAPGQDTVGGVQMAERLLSQLDDLERAGGLRIGISAGVVACPEHGDDAGGLLHKADEAMWRARSVGQPVGVGVIEQLLQDR